MMEQGVLWPYMDEGSGWHMAGRSSLSVQGIIYSDGEAHNGQCLPVALRYPDERSATRNGIGAILL